MGRRLAPLLAVLCAALVVVDTASADETPTPVSHLVPYNLDWLAYIPPEDAPPVPYAVCIVDTGLAITPDTPPDDPVNGPILKRLAIDDGPGTPHDSFNALHGTQMAFAAGARQNQWGTVGVWPFGRLVSVRATLGSEPSLRATNYQLGLQKCLANNRQFPQAVILWALGCPECAFTPEQSAQLQAAIDQAGQAGVRIIAAAGNTAGPVTGPASFPGVMPVAAGSSSGELCSGASDVMDIVVGPACPTGSADPLTGAPLVFEEGGSSTASASAAALYAMLRSYRPSATSAEIDAWIRSGTRPVDGRRMIDGEAAARAAGLDELVRRARSRQRGQVIAPPTPAESSPLATLPHGGDEVPCPAPLRPRFFRQQFRSTLQEWPSEVDLIVKAQGTQARFSKGQTVRVRRVRAPRAILMRFVTVASPVRKSRWIKLVLGVDGRRYSLRP